jgi:hypothetical protein
MIKKSNIKEQNKNIKIGIIKNKSLKVKNDYKQYKEALDGLRMTMNSVVIRNNLNYLK